MRTVWKIIYPGVLVVISLAAVWLWWEDGMWWHGAMPTHGMIHVLGGCSVALALNVIGRLRRGGGN